MGALRVVCYVNQFFGQLGGEEKAGVSPQLAQGAVGAARAVQQALGDAGTVVATVICGDNYVAEQTERAVSEMLAFVAAERPDLLIAGPAFLAGRYGVACGRVRSLPRCAFWRLGAAGSHSFAAKVFFCALQHDSSVSDKISSANNRIS